MLEVSKICLEAQYHAQQVDNMVVRMQISTIKSNVYKNMQYKKQKCCGQTKEKN